MLDLIVNHVLYVFPHILILQLRDRRLLDGIKLGAVCPVQYHAPAARKAQTSTRSTKYRQFVLRKIVLVIKK